MSMPSMTTPALTTPALTTPALTHLPEALFDAARRGDLVPYLGPGLLAATPQAERPPASGAELAAFLSARVSVPHKVRTLASGAAQFIENFKHRKTLAALMREAFSPSPAPHPVLGVLAAMPDLPLVVHAWQDDTVVRAFAGRAGVGHVQGLSPAENALGDWFRHCDVAGEALVSPHVSTMGAGETPEAARAWRTLIYSPLGCVWPAGHFLVSDADFVEVLTEIDIQTPIPPLVQARRTGRSFVFIGCRFDDQISRTFARQIMKRSSQQHWAILPEAPTRNEARFLDEQAITPIALPLDATAQALAIGLAGTTRRVPA